MSHIFLIAIGGALGSVLRYSSFDFVTKIIRNTNYTHFPLHTIFVNVLGSMFAGILYFFMIKYSENFDPKIKSFLFIGFLGGFTTFSAFSHDFFRLFTAGHQALAFTYATASFVFAILALFFGFYLMKAIC